MTRKTQLKWIANGNVLGWSAFWVFGYLALTASPDETGQMIGAALLALAGLALGVWCYLRLMRGSA